MAQIYKRSVPTPAVKKEEEAKKEEIIEEK